MSTGTIRISSLSAYFNKDTELLGKQDPYVVFEIGNKKVTTKHIKGAGAGEAAWDDTYAITDIPVSANMELTMIAYNHNTLRPDGLIGAGATSVDKITSGSATRVPLVDKKNSHIGDINFVANLTGFPNSASSRSGTSSTTGTGTGAGYGTGAGAGAAGVGAGAAGVGAGAAGYGTSGRTGTTTTSTTGTTGATGGATSLTAAEKETRYLAEEQNRRNLEKMNLGTGTATTSEYVSTTATQGVGMEGATSATGVTCGRQYYTVTEDRPVIREQIQYIREHHPYEKEFVVETKPTGRERELPNRPGDEVVDYKVREVDRVTPALCEGAPVVTPANVAGTGTLSGAGITTAGASRTTESYGTSSTTTAGGYGSTATTGRTTGDYGTTGRTGTTGTTGDYGSTSRTGATGTTGDYGTTGRTGTTGDYGTTGRTGTTGTSSSSTTRNGTSY